MKEIPLGTIADWAEGRLKETTAPEMRVDHAVIDSRDAGKNSIFFCIKGEKSDGHDYIGEVREKGGYSIGERASCDIIVTSAVDALGKVAARYRELLNAKIVTVTGSNGKTTTTGIAAFCLSSEYRVESSPRSYNNNIGLPISILKMQEDTDVGVFEIGANNPGEIGYLTRIARPDIGVITNVGEAHLGYFGSIEQILKAKFELADNLGSNAVIVYNYDQEEVRAAAEGYGLDRISFGLNGEADIYGEIISQTSSGTTFKVSGFEFKINLPGEFNVYNCLAAIAVCSRLGMEHDSISASLEEYKGPEHRMENIKIDDIEILDDCYNANPSSVKKLFEETLKIYPQKDIIAVIGEMRELGEHSQRLHLEIGRFIASRKNVKYLLAGGEYARFFSKGS